MKPADIYIPNWMHDGRSAAIDIGITSVTNAKTIDLARSKLLVFLDLMDLY